MLKGKEKGEEEEGEDKKRKLTARVPKRCPIEPKSQACTIAISLILYPSSWGPRLCDSQQTTQTLESNTLVVHRDRWCLLESAVTNCHEVDSDKCRVLEIVVSEEKGMVAEWS
jgi:hypothetical protein